MSTLRIQFPEKDGVSSLHLRGARITIGRRPTNVIQILDRTLSGDHAEFIAEADGHYRLHDLGSTNGTSVNGERVTEYHLHEAAKLAFGSVTCEFDPGAAEDATAAETLPTLAEIEAFKRLNYELREQLDTLREEMKALRGHAAVDAADAASPKAPEDAAHAELQRLIEERAKLKETEQHQAHEIARLESDLSLVKRDRANLQNALRQMNAAELARTKREAQPALAAPSAKEAPPASMLPKPSASATNGTGVKTDLRKPAVASATVSPKPPPPKPPLPKPTAPSVAHEVGAAKTLAPQPRPAAGNGGIPQPKLSPLPAAANPIGPTGTTRITLPKPPTATERLIPPQRKGLQSQH